MSPTRGDAAAGPAPGDRLLLLLLLVAVACVAVGTATAAVAWLSAAPPAMAPAPLALPAGAAPPAPVEISVPSIGVDVPLQRLGLDATGTVVPPGSADDAGWVEVTSRPGRPGPAVVAGHVSSRSGPGVFARLDELRPGDSVVVGLDDGSRVRYVVRASEQHPKDAFPTDAVYGASPVPVLRLVTCGGTVDPATGHHRDNVVVYADLAPPAPA